MKKKDYKLILINILVSIILISCSNSSIQNDKKDIKVQDSLNNQMRELLNIQSPIEYVYTIKESNNKYNDKSILPSHYISPNIQGRETFLGIILADLLFKCVYYQDINFELGQIKVLSNDLKIREFFNLEVNWKTKNDNIYYPIEKLDSLCYITALGIENYLQKYNKQDKYDKYIKILFGYWIESIYIQIDQIDKENEYVIVRAIDDINVLSKFKDQVSDNKIVENIKKIEEVFNDNVKVIRTSGKLPDPDDSMVIIADDSIEFIYSETGLQNVIVEINKIHELILQEIKY